jgi:uncharacterized membrane protein
MAAEDPVGTEEEMISRLRERDSMRLEALSDGIFAVAMTLLVFDIKAPDVPAAQLPAALLALWPNFFCYAVSFALLGIYWWGQVAQFQYIRKVDNTMTWLSIVLLASVVLLPFSTSLLSKDPYTMLSIVIYGLNLIAIGLLLALIWKNATDGYRLVDRNLPVRIIRFAYLRCLVGPACYLIAILISLVSPTVSLVIFLLIPLLYILPGLNKYWLKAAGKGL